MGYYVDLEDMGTFVGALSYTLMLAGRWGYLEVPEGQQVVIMGCEIREDHLVSSGTAVVMAKEGGDSPSIVLTECVFSDSTVAGVADELIAVASKVIAMS